MSGLAPLRTGQKPGAFRIPSGELWKSSALSTSMGSAAKPEGRNWLHMAVALRQQMSKYLHRSWFVIWQVHLYDEKDSYICKSLWILSTVVSQLHIHALTHMSTTAKTQQHSCSVWEGFITMSYWDVICHTGCHFSIWYILCTFQQQTENQIVPGT